MFVGRKSEATLCSEFIPIISQSLDTYVPEEMRTFRSLFQYLMELASQKSFNLVIDEFQEFYNINESVYSDMQNLWDTYRKKSQTFSFVIPDKLTYWTKTKNNPGGFNNELSTIPRNMKAKRDARNPDYIFTKQRAKFSQISKESIPLEGEVEVKIDHPYLL